MVTTWRGRPAGSTKATRTRTPQLPTGWMDSAACRGYDPELWWPEDEPDQRRRSTIRRMARDICLACPVAIHCRDYARATRPAGGVWAGIDHGNVGKPKGSGR